jgi:hypothetical protein
MQARRLQQKHVASVQLTSASLTASLVKEYARHACAISGGHQLLGVIVPSKQCSVLKALQEMLGQPQLS